MTMTVALRCEGQRGRCRTLFERVTHNSRIVRDAARAAGWHCPDTPTGHLCPSCVPPRAPRACYRCTSRLPFADALGHDKTGHTCINNLERTGIKTWKQLLDLRLDELKLIPGVGPKSVARVREVQRATARKRKAA